MQLSAADQFLPADLSVWFDAQKQVCAPAGIGVFGDTQYQGVSGAG